MSERQDHIRFVARNTAEVLDWELCSHWVLELIHSRAIGCWQSPSFPVPAVRRCGATLDQVRKTVLRLMAVTGGSGEQDVVILVTLRVPFCGYSRLSNIHGGKN